MSLSLVAGGVLVIVLTLGIPTSTIASAARATAMPASQAAAPTPSVAPTVPPPSPTATMVPAKPTSLPPTATTIIPTPVPTAAPSTPTPTPAAPARGTLNISPAVVAPGGELEVAASDYGRRESLAVWLTDPAGADVPQPHQTTSREGGTYFTITVPATGRPGHWTLSAQGQASTRLGTITFTVSAPTAASSAATATSVPPAATTTAAVKDGPATTNTPTVVSEVDDEPTTTATPVPTATPTMTPEPTETATPTATSTPTPTPTPTPVPDPDHTIDHLLPPAAPGGPLPARLARTYFGAAARAAGVSVEVLLAIAAVESGFTPTAVGPYLPQFAGTEDEHALGMMQFLPSTYRPYAPMVDRMTGKGLGMRGIWDPESSVYAAAFYLRDSGARASLDRALYAYNHADWYVRLVRAWAVYYANGGTIGYAPVVELERVMEMADPTAIGSLATAEAQDNGPGQAERSAPLGDGLAGLLGVDLLLPSWPSYPLENKPQPR